MCRHRCAVCGEGEVRGVPAPFTGGFNLVRSVEWSSKARGGFHQMQREGHVFQAEGLACAKTQGCWGTWLEKPHRASEMHSQGTRLGNAVPDHSVLP